MRLALVKSVLPTSPSLQSQQEHFKQSSCQKESKAWIVEREKKSYMVLLFFRFEIVRSLSYFDIGAIVNSKDISDPHISIFKEWSVRRQCIVKKSCYLKQPGIIRKRKLNMIPNIILSLECVSIFL